MSWFVYMLECGDGTIYTGITNDLDRRLEQHQNGIGCKYTRGRGPVALMASRKVDSRSEALSLEYHIKSLDRSAKIREAQVWNQ